MYLEDYIRQTSMLSSEENPLQKQAFSESAGCGLFAGDPGLVEIWGLYRNASGDLELRRLASRTRETPL